MPCQQLHFSPERGVFLRHDSAYHILAKVAAHNLIYFSLIMAGGYYVSIYYVDVIFTDLQTWEQEPCSFQVTNLLCDRVEIKPCSV